MQSLRVHAEQSLVALGEKKAALNSLEVAVGTAIRPADFPNTLRAVGGNILKVTLRQENEEDRSVTLVEQVDYEVEIHGLHARVLVGFMRIAHNALQPAADIVSFD